MAKQVTPSNPYLSKSDAKALPPKKENPYAKQFKTFVDGQDKSNGYDEDLINEVGAGNAASYAGMQKVYKQKKGDALDAYEDYVDRETLHGGQFDFDELNRIRANNQSNWEQAGHAVARVATNVVPQIVSGFASMLDIPGYFSAEEAANNSIVNWAQDLKKEVDEDWFPIYENAPGKSMQLGDFSWWMSRGSGLVESVGAFLAQGMGAGKLASMTLKGISTASRAKQLTQALIGAEKSKGLFNGLNTLTTATMLNQSEAVIEATQVFKDTYADRLAKGYDYGKAKKAASEAAATTMSLNRINILLNLTSASKFLTPLKASRNPIKLTNLSHTLGEVAKEGTQEAAEELVNLAASKAGMAKGRGESYGLENAMDDITTMEGMEAAFLGAIGGMAQTGGTNALKYSKYGPGSTKDEAGNRISFINNQKQQYEKQQQIIKDFEEKGVKMTDTMMNLQDTIIFEEKIRVAQAAGNVAEVEKLQQDRFESQALKAFESGTTETLENLYKAESEKDPAVVGAEYVAKAKKAVEDLRTLEAVYNNFEDYENVDDIFYNRANKIRVDGKKEFIQSLKKQADFELSQQVNTIAKNYKFEREQEVLFKKEGVVQSTETRTTEAPLTYSSANLENNTGDTEHNKAVYEKFLAEVQKLDSYEKATQYATQLENVEKQDVSLSQQFKDLTSKAGQQKAAEYKAEQIKLRTSYDALQKATSISEVEKIATGIENAPFKEAVQLKLKEIQTGIDAAAKAKKTEATVKEFNTRITNSTLEDLDKLQDEIRNAELSDKNKSNLLANLDRRARKLNGEETADDVEEEDDGSGIPGFDPRTPEEIESEVKASEKDAATEIPKDLPDPKTEKEDVEKEVTDTAKKLLETDGTKVIGEDEQGNLVYNFGRSENAYDHGAYLSREFSQISEDGVVEREEITDEIENQQLLDPDFLTPGTELIMEVDTEYEGDKYDAASDTRQTIPWSVRETELRAKYGDDFMNSDEYINEVPIKVTTTDGNTVFYVHDNAWYREENLDNTAEGIAQNKAFNRQIREKIIKSKRVKTKVSSKSFGKLFKSADGKSISVSEAMPDDNLIMAVGRNGAPELGGDVSVILGKGAKLLPSTIKEGRLYAIVRVGPNEFLPIPLEREPITEEIANTIVLAVEAHLTGDQENPVVKSIIENNGLDITELDDLRRYVSQFIYLYPTAKGKGLENILMSQGGAKSTLKSNRPLVSITATGIEFGKPGVAANKSADGTIKYARVISKNFGNSTKTQKENAAKLIKLRELLMSGNILSNAKRAPLSKGENVAIVLNNEGETRTIKYSDHLKNSHKTNIRSINVGTEGNPKWVYTLQPVITFDTAFAGIKPGAKPKAAKKPATPTTARPKRTAAPAATTTTVPTTELETKKAELEKAENERLALINKRNNDATVRKAIKDSNSGVITIEQLDQAINIWNVKNGVVDLTLKIDRLKSEIKSLEGTTTTTAEANAAKVAEYRAAEKIENAKIENEIKQVEAEIEEKSKASTEPTTEPYKPKAVVGYSSGAWTTTPDKKTNISLYRLEKDSENSDKGLLYFDPELEMSFARSLNSPDRTIIKFYHEANAFNQNAKGIKTIKPAVVRKNSSGLIELVEEGVIEYVNTPMSTASLSRPATITGTAAKVDTTALENKLQTLKEELTAVYDKYDKLITPLLPASETTPTSDIEAKKADIERRRQEELIANYESLTALMSREDAYKGDDTYSIRINAKYDAELAALEEAEEESESTLTPTEEVEELTGEARIQQYAEEVLEDFTNLDQIEGIIDNIDSGVLTEETCIEAGFESLSEALATYNRAKEIFIERAKKSTTIKLFGGKTKDITGNTPDSAPTSEDAYDEMIVPMTQEQVDAQRSEIDNMIIRGLSPEAQGSLIAYLASTIMSQALAATEVGGKKKVLTAPIFAEHLEVFKNMSAAYKEMGQKNNAAKIDAIIDQFDKVKILVDQHMSLFTIGRVEENFNIDDNVEATGLEKVVYTDDWAFSVDYKATSSADLKKFFTNIQAQDAEGAINNILGWPEMLPYDVVTNTCHEILANKPADYDLMMQILELNVEKVPWLRAVIDNLEKAPERIQNEFVSDMAKHHVDMQFVMWSKDNKGRYSLQRWSSNASSIEQRLRNIWNSNLKGVDTVSNLITTNEDNDYVFNTEIASGLIDRATEFAMRPEEVTNDDLAIWLANFGIVIADETYKDLRSGKYNNQGRKSWNNLFNHSAGLVKVLSDDLQKIIDNDLSLGDSEIMNDSAVKALAKLDASNTLNVYSNSFQAGGKTIYSYGNNNFLINRMRDITAYDNETGEFINQELINGLKEISFTRDSIWLEELTNEEVTGAATRRTLSVGYLSLEALKKKYSPSQDNRKLNNLTAAEHEVTKLGLFFNNSKQEINKETRRVVNFFYPTMSDKSTMLTIQALSREVKLEDGQISQDNINLLIRAMVNCEIDRIRGKQSENIKGYEPNYFYFIPSLNELMIEVNGVEKSFLDIVKDKNDLINSPEVKEALSEHIRDFFNERVNKKLEDWESLGIGQTLKDEKGRVTDQFSFLDKEYMANAVKVGKGVDKVRYAAMDFVFNYLVSNAEAYKLFAGDPALYAKFKTKRDWARTLKVSEDSLTDSAVLKLNLKETFTNMGKRLAGDIAPGLELANSVDNKYYQVFLEDQKMESANVTDSIQEEYFSKIISDFKKNFSGIEGSDAQEYTTWKEHLYVMKQLGRLTKAQVETLEKKLTAQSNGDFSEANELSYEELGMVLQPLKPVYVGNVLDVDDNVDRRVYVKSSSFPLIPQLTQGMQIDKIRQGIEKFESEVGVNVTKDGSPAFVRASFNTANKVGAVKNAVEVFDKNGDVVDDFNIKPENALLLSRANFRIQQDVPYKREKDVINIGVQERALLFGDLLGLDVSPGVTAESLMQLYNDNYQDIFEYNMEKLAEKLGLRETVTTVPAIESLTTVPTTDVFSKVANFNEQLKGVSAIKKVGMQEIFAEEIGEDTLERANFINTNFDKIVKALAAGKINMFFDENQEFKKCE